MNLKYTQPTCEHKDKKHYARGFCKQCYENLPDIRTKKTLSRRITARKAYQENRLAHLMYAQLELLAFPENVKTRRNKNITEYRRKHPEKARLDASIRRARLANVPIIDKTGIAMIYREAKERRARGEDVHVDHIIPLSKGGKHSPDNLRIINSKENLSKGDKLDTPTPTSV